MACGLPSQLPLATHSQLPFATQAGIEEEVRHNLSALRAAREPTRRGDRACVPLGTCQWSRVSERWLLCAGEYQAQGLCSRRRLRRALRFKPSSSSVWLNVPACKC